MRRRRGLICFIASLLVCLEWKSDSFSYRTHLHLNSKVTTLPSKVAGELTSQRTDQPAVNLAGNRQTLMRLEKPNCAAGLRANDAVRRIEPAPRNQHSLLGRHHEAYAVQNPPQDETWLSDHVLISASKPRMLMFFGSIATRTGLKSHSR